MVKIKICGITTLEDAKAAVGFGADALGFVFYGKSPRYIPPREAWEIISALPPFVTTVGVFVNPEISLISEATSTYGIDIVQLHGDETPQFEKQVGARTIKAFRVKDGDSTLEKIGAYRSNGFLLDTYSPGAFGGTGKTFDWEIATKAKKYGRVILSGGLTPQNVHAAVSRVSPYGVDVSSGVELSPGKKDLVRMQTFIQEVRRAENAS